MKIMKTMANQLFCGLKTLFLIIKKAVETPNFGRAFPFSSSSRDRVNKKNFFIKLTICPKSQCRFYLDFCFCFENPFHQSPDSLKDQNKRDGISGSDVPTDLAVFSTIGRSYVKERLVVRSDLLVNYFVLTGLLLFLLVGGECGGKDRFNVFGTKTAKAGTRPIKWHLTKNEKRSVEDTTTLR